MLHKIEIPKVHENDRALIMYTTDEGLEDFNKVMKEMFEEELKKSNKALKHHHRKVKGRAKDIPIKGCQMSKFQEALLSAELKEYTFKSD